MLLQRVREVCSVANPSKPTNVTQRAFDAARGSTPNGASLPVARNIVKSLNLRWTRTERLKWQEVVALAHKPESEQNQRLSRKQAQPYQDWLTSEYVASILKLVAHRLGAATLTPDRYRVVAAELVAADKKRWLHGNQLLFPSEDQIITACGGPKAGGWDRALALAGLQPRPGLGNQGMNRKAPPLTDVLERFYKAHGVQPTFLDLKAFAKANKIPYSREEHKKWSEWVNEWKQSRRAEGLDVPDGPPPRAERADYSVNVGAALPSEQRLTQWTEEDWIAAVVRYLAQLAAGKRERATKRGYDDWAKAQNPRAPSSSNFDKSGGWEAIRRTAITQPAGQPAKPCSSP